MVAMNILVLEVASGAVLVPAAAMLGPYLARRQDRRNTRVLDDGSTVLMPTRTRGGADGGGDGDLGGDGGCGGGDGGGCG